MKRFTRWLRSTSVSAWFAARHGGLRRRRKIVHCLTAVHSNVGDHAQAVAIQEWFARHWPDLAVLEADEWEVRRALPALRWLVRDDDLLFLHSGGNLGDRYGRPERARRAVIESFHRNRIIGLPQTIFFSDAPEGRRQQAISQRVYNAHPDLTIMGRDPRSAELARALFPAARTLCVPDFVLSLVEPSPVAAERCGVLACFRRDEESALSVDARDNLLRQLDLPHEVFDTTTASRIDRRNRRQVMEQTLARFRAAEAVVTDRLHGLIFSVVCRTPCVALATADHKLSASMHWCRDVRFVEMAASPDEVPAALRRVLAVQERSVPDWNAEYFDRLPEQLGLR